VFHTTFPKAKAAIGDYYPRPLTRDNSIKSLGTEESANAVAATLAAVLGVAAKNLCLDAVCSGDIGGGGLWRAHRTH
jgi:hypothetical protein